VGRGYQGEGVAVSWWVVQAEAQREHLTRLLVMRLGYQTYAPRIKHRGRIAWLFPTYLFVQAVERWYPILWTPHVVRLLMTGDRPACLHDKIITAIHNREKGGFVRLPSAGPRLKKGQNVRISNGSFTGQIGLYEGMSSHERAKVLLELLGRKVAVELPQNDLIPLDVVASG
jgi:transcription antitermination factor NusG